MATTTWSSASTDKSQYLDLSNGGLTAAMNNTVDADCGVRGTQTPPSSSKRYFEMSSDGHGTGTRTLAIGITDSVTALGPALFPSPGASGGGGGANWELHTGATSTNVNFNGTHVTGAALTTALADGDKLGILSDDEAHTVTLYHKPGAGAWYAVQTITMTSQIPANRRPYAAGFRTGDKFTLNCGQTAFSQSPIPNSGLMWG